MKATLVHNPNAGDGELSREALIDLMWQAGFTPFYQSSAIGGLTMALEQPADLVVVAGGDGTVAKVLTQMPDRGVPVAILPLGTANNIASSLGIGGSLDALALGLQDAREQKLDIGATHGPWGCGRLVEGLGLGALVRTAIEFDAPDGDRDARLRAARRTLRRILKKAEPDRLAIHLDGRPLPDAQLMVEVLNIACSGPRLFLAPGTDTSDGLVEVAVLEPDQRAQMRRWLEEDEQDGPPPMTFFRGRKVSIVWDGTPLQVDDDRPPVADGGAVVSLELEERQARVLVPNVPWPPGAVT